jgi:HK97 family phage portal protein
MSFFRASAPKPQKQEWKTVGDTLELFKQIFGSNESSTGDSITWEKALRVATVLACVRVVANGLSQVPLKLFLESPDGRSRLPAKDHPLYWVLFRKPNPWQTSAEFRQTLAAHLMLCGNAFAFKNVVNGRVVELIQFEPGQVEVERLPDGDTEYTVTLGKGKKRDFPSEAIWHVRTLSWNTWMGLEPVQMAREAIGLSLATERQQSRFFKNGASVTGTYSVQEKLNKEQYQDLRNFIIENTSGENAGAPLILDRGAQWLSRSMTNIDAQLDETRRTQVEEVCRALGVFPQMVGQSDKTSTFASAEAFFIAHVVHTLAPLYELIEQSISCHLLSDKEMRNGYSPKFVEEGLLRGSMRDTSEVLDKYVNGGLMTPNEGRAKLDLNPDDDPESDKLRVPANIVGKQPATDPAPDPAPTKARQRALA